MKLRFATAREVFDAFPVARDDIAAEPTDEPPLTFLNKLASTRTPEDAIGFCAYLLTRREAVWWAHQCVQMLVPSRTTAEAAALRAAESWVRDPDENRRSAALVIGMEGDRQSPATWVALAAGWAGGSLIETDHGAASSPPHLTAKAARVAVLTALAAVGARERESRLRACIENGERLAGAEAAVAR